MLWALSRDEDNFFCCQITINFHKWIEALFSSVKNVLQIPLRLLFSFHNLFSRKKSFLMNFSEKFQFHK
jgi:hypothetical protein